LQADPIGLGFDTSAAHSPPALVSGRRVLAARHEAMAQGQAERLLPLCAALLADTGAGWRDLAAIGAGIGPGNFTGVRIAVAAARGLAMGLGIPAVGISRFQALAAGQTGPVLACVMAPRGQVWIMGPGSPPRLIDPEAWTPPAAWRGLPCLGDAAGAVAARTGGAVAATAEPLAVAVARIALDRRADPGPPPAPMYLRPPDAALPETPPPVILP
jgi:tRNA threonylcarbamoyladenosine biosynthesis protein TsaB